MKKIDIVLQKEITECGYAALIMILSSFGYRIDLESFRIDHVISSEGASFEDIAKIAENYGLYSGAYAVAQENVGEIKLPAILQIHGGHFVVIERVDHRYLHIIDPAVGRRRILRKELYKYVGYGQKCYILEFEKSLGFTEGDKRIFFTLFDIIKHVKGIHSYYILSFFFALILQFVIILTPLYVQFSMDKVANYDNKELLILLLYMFIFIYTLDVIVRYAREQMLIILESNLRSKITIDFFEKMLSLPLGFFKNRRPASISNKFDALSKIINIISKVTTTIFVDITTVVVLLAGMMILNIELSVILLSIMSLYLVLKYFNYKINMRLLSEYWLSSGRESSALYESIENIKTIKLFGMENKILNNYRKKLHKRISVSKKLDITSNVFLNAGNTLNHIETLIVIYFGTLLILEKSLTIGMLYTFIFYKNIFSISFASAMDKIVTIRETKSELEYIKDIIASKSEIKFSETPPVCQEYRSFFDGEIEAKNLSFVYERGDVIALNGLNFLVPAGESLCIVGESGSGKSTLLNILTGLCQINKGELCLSGVDICQIPPSTLRGKISYMASGEDFFDGSLIYNITLEKTPLDMDKLINILIGLDMYSYISNEVDGGLYGYMGIIKHRFSTGQKQRLLLARALYKNSEIILLDEPTSGLDTDTEKKVIEYIISLQKRIIIATHRESFFRYFKNTLRITKGANDRFNKV